ncbi:MAG: hypothetical protein NVS4B11_07950 [Ktedonobacteraceae bacterium]
MTTQQFEHNEANRANSSDEAVVDQQHTAETFVVDVPPSSDEVAASATEPSHDDTSSASVEPNNTVSTEQSFSSTAEIAPKDTANRTSEASTDLPLSEESPFAQATAALETTEEVQAPIAQNVAPAETTEDVAREEPIASSTQTEHVADATVDAVAAPVFVEESAAVVSEVMPLAETDEEAVRPFTSFIAEFHQAQAEAEAQAEAHLTASLQESQAETFAEFAMPETSATLADQPVTLKDVLPPVDFGEGSSFVPTSDGAATVNTIDDTAQSPAEAAATEENQRVAAIAETSHEEEAIPTPAVQRPERPVSPLLRPALRPRPPRHAVTRHRDEPTAPTTFATASAETATPTQEASVAPEQTTETPKPPRRYRFDRPAPQTPSLSKPAQATAMTSNNSAVLTPPPATQPTPTFARVEENQVTTPEIKAPTVSTSTTDTVGTMKAEQQSGEPASMESTDTIPSPVEHGRRRHNPERQREKEQSVTPPVIETPSVADIAAALVSESKPTAEEVAPEDLPPLEYADLQKANSSRRRRRHRTPTPGTPVAKETVASPNGAQPAVQSITPAPQAPLAPNAPVKPAASAANPYTITSGYTVGQMNQGNEASGPFMGPEPSPARGSVNTTRDGRTVRVESQPLRTASYPTVGTATGAQGSISAASMNHFANVVSQAIQTQADRMVVELRRANQAPTNVSVSLPPFPSTERVGIFVDVANLLYSARTQRIAIDFGKLLDFLRGNRRLIRAHAYCPTSPQPGDEQMFLTAVKGLGYRITTKNYKIFASGAKKADLDLDLCMDVVRIVDGGAVDCIVLVSGDSDFMPMLDYCSDHGVRVEVAAFDEAMSATLRQSCDLFVNLSMLEEIRA